MANLKSYLDELYGTIISDEKDMDPIHRMDFSRYPFSKDYQPHFYVRSLNNEVVDLENFVDRLKEIGDNLEQLSGYYKDMVDYKIESEMC